MDVAEEPALPLLLLQVAVDVARDVGRAIRVAKGIRTGVLSVNSSHSVHLEAPFGGFKRSGMGREMGMHAVQLYTEVKNVFFSQE